MIATYGRTRSIKICISPVYVRHWRVLKADCHCTEVSHLQKTGSVSKKLLCSWKMTRNHIAPYHIKCTRWIPHAIKSLIGLFEATVANSFIGNDVRDAELIN